MKTTLLVLVAILVGCATTDKLTKLNIGMSKTDTVKVMGSPEDITNDGSQEIYHYQMSNGWVYVPYLVFFKDGHLMKYGKETDFMSSQERMHRETISAQKQTAPASSDINCTSKSNVFGGQDTTCH